MPINIACPSCDREYTLADHQAGRKVQCKSCGRGFIVRGPDSERNYEDREEPPRRYRDDDRPRSRRDEEDRRSRWDDDRPTRPRRSRPAGSGKGLLIAGLAVGALLLLLGTGLVLYFVLGGGGAGGGLTGQPQAEIVGKWIGESEDWEFHADGSFLRTIKGINFLGVPGTTEGRYRFKEGNVVQFDGALAPQAEVYVSPAEMRMFHWTATNAQGQTVERLFGVSMFFRRAGMEGPIRDGDGLGGTLVQTRKRVVGRWLDDVRSWAFTEDGRVERPFYSSATYRVIDSKTLEITEKDGKKQRVEMAPDKDTMRVWISEPGDNKIGVSSFWTRASADYHEDDPAAGNPRDLIVGRWESAKNVIPQSTLEFTADGKWQRLIPQGSSTHRRHGRYRWEANGNLVMLDYDGAWARLDQQAQDKFAENSKKTYRIGFTKGKLALSQSSNIDQINRQRQFLGLPPLTGNEDLPVSGEIYRRLE